MSLFEDPAHWRKRAEEMRQLALVAEPGIEMLLESGAQSYDDLAARAEKRLNEATVKTNPSAH
jgi:hypothetical protein